MMHGSDLSETPSSPKRRDSIGFQTLSNRVRANQDILENVSTSVRMALPRQIHSELSAVFSTNAGTSPPQCWTTDRSEQFYLSRADCRRIRSEIGWKGQIMRGPG